MTREGYCVAIVGASSLSGTQVREALRERQFPVREWRLYDRVDRLGAGDDGEEGAVVRPIEQADLAGVDFAFACDPAAAAVKRPSAAVWFDLTDASGEVTGAPLVVPEVNPDDVADAAEGGVIANPATGAIALAIILKPIEDAAQVRRVVVTCFEPASSAGTEGIEELAQQCRELLGGSPADDGPIFPRRIAFNLIPQVGDFVAADKARGEWQIESQTQRLLDLPDLPITVTSVRVPLFYGQGYVVNVETEGPLDAAAARAVLRESPGVLMLDEAGTHPYPTPIDTLENDAVFVGRLRDDPTVPYGLNLWLTLDGTRKGGAVNAVQVAELLVRERR